MPQPTVRDVHLDAMLSNLSVAFTQDTSGFIATKVFPVIGVDKKSDKYYVYPKGDWLRDEARLRADSEESAGGGYVLSSDSYEADVYAYHKDVGDQVRDNADSPINVDRDATAFVMTKMLLRMEKQWATDFFTTSKWGTDITGVTTAPANATEARQWTDYANSTPIEDIDKAKRKIKRMTGYRANTLVLGYDVFQALKNHPDIIERFKYTSSRVVTEEILAALFGIDRIFVADSIINTAQKGLTDSISFIHGRHALLLHVAGHDRRDRPVPHAAPQGGPHRVGDGLGQQGHRDRPRLLLVEHRRRPGRLVLTSGQW
jgi:hypothetical protein